MANKNNSYIVNNEKRCMYSSSDNDIIFSASGESDSKQYWCFSASGGLNYDNLITGFEPTSESGYVSSYCEETSPVGVVTNSVWTKDYRITPEADFVIAETPANTNTNFMKENYIPFYQTLATSGNQPVYSDGSRFIYFDGNSNWILSSDTACSAILTGILTNDQSISSYLTISSYYNADLKNSTEFGSIDLASSFINDDICYFGKILNVPENGRDKYKDVFCYCFSRNNSVNMELSGFSKIIFETNYKNDCFYKFNINQLSGRHFNDNMDTYIENNDNSDGTACWPNCGLNLLSCVFDSNELIKYEKIYVNDYATTLEDSGIVHVILVPCNSNFKAVKLGQAASQKNLDSASVLNLNVLSGITIFGKQYNIYYDATLSYDDRVFFKLLSI